MLKFKIQKDHTQDYNITQRRSQ